MKNDVRVGIGVLITTLALGACGKPTTAPEANPEIAKPAEAKTGPSTASAIASVPSAKPATASVVIDGFDEFKFGMEIAKVKSAPALVKRCKTKSFADKDDKEFPGQSFDPQYVQCDSTIADRYAGMRLKFDHTASLYLLEFYFFGSIDFKVKSLHGGEIDKFIADLRAVLDPKYGKPADTSSEKLGGKEYALEWLGRTADDPPHDVRIVLSMDQGGPLGHQGVTWIDKTREDAMKKQIEKERTESIKAKGL